MSKIVLLSVLLIVGLIASQLLSTLLPADYYVVFEHTIRFMTTAALGFVMIRVGYEFDIDKSRLKSYGWDYVVAVTSATFPWIFVALYFIFILSDASPADTWKEALLASRTVAPTSAGILFTMLAASGLAGTWMYHKIRVLAIFDDVDTILLMIPLKIMLVGWKWQLGVVIAPMIAFLWAAWRYLHQLRIPITFPWVLSYTVLATLAIEMIYHSSKLIDKFEPIHIEALLPAFALGCIIVRKKITVRNSNGEDIHVDILEEPGEKRLSFLVSMVFMVLVGLSMPAIIHIGGQELTSSSEHAVHSSALTLSWGWIAIHVIFVTMLANLGKLFPLFCYRKEAHWKERLALSIGMFPRGEVGAGVLIISIAYGLSGDIITVAMLFLALNLLLTGLYIIVVKKLLGSIEPGESTRVSVNVR